MSHFYSEIQGARGPATRTGTKNSGIRANVRSWSGDATLRLVHNELTGCDELGFDLRPEHGTNVRLLAVEDYGALLRTIQDKDPKVMKAIATLQKAGEKLSDATYKAA